MKRQPQRRQSQPRKRDSSDLAQLPIPSGHDESLRVGNNEQSGVWFGGAFLTGIGISLILLSSIFWNSPFPFPPGVLGLDIIIGALGLMTGGFGALALGERQGHLFDPETESVFSYKGWLGRHVTFLFRFDEIDSLAIRYWSDGDNGGYSVDLLKTDESVVSLTTCGWKSSAEKIARRITAVTELQAKLDALYLIHFLRAQGQPQSAWLAALSADQTISEPVRQRALQFAREWKP